jgi:hypothetical protein
MLDINKRTVEQFCDDISRLLKSGRLINAMKILEKEE